MKFLTYFRAFSYAMIAVAMLALVLAGFLLLLGVGIAVAAILGAGKRDSQVADAAADAPPDVDSSGRRCVRLDPMKVTKKTRVPSGTRISAKRQVTLPANALRQAGLRVGHLGNTSVRYEIGLFAGDDNGSTRRSGWTGAGRLDTAA